MYVYMYMCMYVYVCMYVCGCVVYIYVYVYTYIPSYQFCFSKKPWLIRILSILPQVNLHPSRVTLYSYNNTLPVWNSLDLHIHYCIIFSWASQNSEQEWPQWAYAICGSFLTTRKAEAIHTNIQLRTQHLFVSTIEPQFYSFSSLLSLCFARMCFGLSEHPSPDYIIYIYISGFLQS